MLSDSSSSDFEFRNKKRRKKPRREKALDSQSSSDDELSPIKKSAKCIRYTLPSSSSSSSCDDSSSPILPNRRSSRKVIVESESTSLSCSYESDGPSLPISKKSKGNAAQVPAVSDSEGSGGKCKPGPSGFRQSSSDDDTQSSSDSSEKCIICFKSLSTIVAQPSGCTHSFHQQCIATWSKTSNTCPIDRVPYTHINVVNNSGQVLRRDSVSSPEQPIYDDLEPDNPTFCQVCWQHDRESEMLLCDSCEDGYHLDCLNPPLESVPDGEWFCPQCTTVFSSDGEDWHYRTSDLTRRRRIRRTRNTSVDEFCVFAQRLHHSSPILRELSPSVPSTSGSNNISNRATVRTRSSNPRKRKKKRQRRQTSTRYKVELVTTEDGNTVEVKLAIQSRRRRKKSRKKKSGSRSQPRDSCRDINSRLLGRNDFHPAPLDISGSVPTLDYISGCEAEDEEELRAAVGEVGLLRASVTRTRRPMSRKAAAAIISNPSGWRRQPTRSIPQISRPSVNILDNILRDQSLWHAPKSSIISNSEGQVVVTLGESGTVDTAVTSAALTGGSGGSSGLMRGGGGRNGSGGPGPSGTGGTSSRLSSGGDSGRCAGGSATVSTLPPPPLPPLIPPPQPPMKLCEDDDFDLYADIEPPNTSLNRLAPPPEPPPLLLALDSVVDEVVGTGGSSPEEGLIIDDHQDTYDPDQPNSPSSSPAKSVKDELESIDLPDIPLPENSEVKLEDIKLPSPGEASNSEQDDSDSEVPIAGRYSAASLKIARQASKSSDEEGQGEDSYIDDIIERFRKAPLPVDISREKGLHLLKSSLSKVENREDSQKKVEMTESGSLVDEEEKMEVEESVPENLEKETFTQDENNEDKKDVKETKSAMSPTNTKKTTSNCQDSDDEIVKDLIPKEGKEVDVSTKSSECKAEIAEDGENLVNDIVESRTAEPDETKDISEEEKNNNTESLSADKVVETTEGKVEDKNITEDEQLSANESSDKPDQMERSRSDETIFEDNSTKQIEQDINGSADQEEVAELPVESPMDESVIREEIEKEEDDKKDEEDVDEEADDDDDDDDDENGNDNKDVDEKDEMEALADNCKDDIEDGSEVEDIPEEGEEKTLSEGEVRENGHHSPGSRHSLSSGEVESDDSSLSGSSPEYDSKKKRGKGFRNKNDKSSDKDGLVDITDEEISTFEKNWETEKDNTFSKVGLEGLDTEAISECEDGLCDNAIATQNKKSLERFLPKEEGEIVTDDRNEFIPWKRVTKTTKERSYRDKAPDTKAKEDTPDKKKEKKKKEKRKELERYDVRKLIGEKPKKRKTDEFGRDLSTSDSGSESRDSLYRSDVRRGRDWSSPRRRSRENSLNKRRRSESRTQQRRRERKTSLDRSRDRQKSRKTSRDRVRERSSGRTLDKRSRGRSSYRRSRERSYDRNRGRERDRRRRSLGRRKDIGSPDKRRREKGGRSSASERKGSSSSCSTCSCSSCEREKLASSNMITVTVPNKLTTKGSKKRKEKKKDKTRKSKKDSKRRRTRSPVPSKEVFTSGDNILVSVNFKSSKSNLSDGRRANSRRIWEDEIRKKKDKENQLSRNVVPALSSSSQDKEKKGKQRKKVVSNAKPIAFIDLDISPFREREVTPTEVIVLTDSDKEGNDQETTRRREEQAVSTGPKTPPEPPVKFSINSKPQLRAINPLMEVEPEAEIEDNEEEMVGHKGPNTPPEPPETYDPFEPTKSRSPSPQDDQHVSRGISPRVEMTADVGECSDPVPPSSSPQMIEPPPPSQDLLPQDNADDLDFSPGGGGDSPYSPGSSEGDDLFEPPLANKMKTSRPSLPPLPSIPLTSNKHTPLKLTPSPLKKRPNNQRLTPTPKKGSRKEIGIKLDEDQLKMLDELPNSAVEMQYLKKLNRQERVVEEVKLVLKPHYGKKHITKEEYKEIMRKAVPKICHSRSGVINPVKIRQLIEAYVKKYRHKRKKQTVLPGGVPAIKTKPKLSMWS